MDVELEKMIKDIRQAANIPEDDIEFNRKIGEYVFKYMINTKFANETINKGFGMIKDVMGVMTHHNNRDEFALRPHAGQIEALPPPTPIADEAPRNNMPPVENPVEEPPLEFWRVLE